MAGGGEAMRAGIVVQGPRGQFVGGNTALTSQQQGFVTAYLANGGDAEKAASLAGYANPPDDGWRLTANPVVWAAILSRWERRRARTAIKAGDKLAEVLDKPDAASAAYVAAIRLALEAGGVIGRNARGPEGGGQGGKPLAEMSLAELGDAMKGQKEALATLKGLLTEGEAPDVAPRASRPGRKTIDA